MGRAFRWQPEDGFHHGLLEARRTVLRAAAQRQGPAIDRLRVRGELLDLALKWRRTLQEGPQHARAIEMFLLDGRVTLTPTGPEQWHLHGVATFAELLEREIFPSVWRPHRDWILLRLWAGWDTTLSQAFKAAANYLSSRSLTPRRFRTACRTAARRERRCQSRGGATSRVRARLWARLRQRDPRYRFVR
jgi:hypothetical protein